MVSNSKNLRTITAIATPPGQGGIGILRISGPQAKTIGLQISGRTELTPRYCYFTTFQNLQGEPLDQGLAIYFPSPYSYTGEDMVELQGHGGSAIMNALRQAVLEAGAESAKPGEFTRRAYLNDRIDLTQAEAVAQLIEAKHQSMARAALRSLEGELSRLIKGISRSLIELRTFIEGALDFPDEDVDLLAENQIHLQVEDLLTQVIQLRNRAAKSIRLGRGYQLVLIGRPNAGKSSLLNALSDRESAIVTEHGGTTRDILQEPIEIDGLPIELTDTAGLRETEDAIEQEGVRRAREQIEKADLIIYLVDSCIGWTQEDLREWQRLPQARREWVWSKADQIFTEGVRNQVSVIDKPGIEPLVDQIRTHFKSTEAQDALGARERHLEILDRVRGYLENAQTTLSMYGSGDLMAQDLHWAQEALGEITGNIHSDDLLDKIFSTFCIGK